MHLLKSISNQFHYFTALRQPLSPWLLNNLKMRLGSAMTGDEALEMAMQRVSERGLRTPETPVQVLEYL